MADKPPAAPRGALAIDRDVRSGAEAGRDQSPQADQMSAIERPEQSEHREPADEHSDNGVTAPHQNSSGSTRTLPRLDESPKSAAPRGAERALALARIGARHKHADYLAHPGEHIVGEPKQHVGRFTSCPHRDCVLVRSWDVLQAAPASPQLEVAPNVQKFACYHCGRVFLHAPEVVNVDGIPGRTFFFCSAICRALWRDKPELNRRAADYGRVDAKEDISQAAVASRNDFDHGTIQAADAPNYAEWVSAAPTSPVFASGTNEALTPGGVDVPTAMLAAGAAPMRSEFPEFSHAASAPLEELQAAKRYAEIVLEDIPKIPNHGVDQHTLRVVAYARTLANHVLAVLQAAPEPAPRTMPHGFYNLLDHIAKCVVLLRLEGRPGSVPWEGREVLQAVLEAVAGTLDPSTQIADHPNVKFAQMERLKLLAWAWLEPQKIEKAWRDGYQTHVRGARNIEKAWAASDYAKALPAPLGAAAIQGEKS